jgi:hypothetical protein
MGRMGLLHVQDLMPIPLATFPTLDSLPSLELRFLVMDGVTGTLSSEQSPSMVKVLHLATTELSGSAMSMVHTFTNSSQMER